MQAQKSMRHCVPKCGCYNEDVVMLTVLEGGELIFQLFIVDYFNQELDDCIRASQISCGGNGLSGPALTEMDIA